MIGSGVQLTAMLLYLLQGFGLGLAAAAQPGPFQTYVISQALSRGWQRSWPIAFAPLLSDGLVITVVLLALSHMPSGLQNILFIASGIFILYLTYNAAIAWRASAAGPIEEGAKGYELIRATLLNVINPNPYIYWSLVNGPILLAAWRQAPINGISFVVSFYSTFVICLIGIIFVFSASRRMGPQVNRLLLGFSVIVLLVFGLFQLWRGITGIL
jgi:threonine/homoserine/homoserine lactone efflux protein